jgi:nitrate reductase / nitrite oxidoreductase, beta subunit
VVLADDVLGQQSLPPPKMTTTCTKRSEASYGPLDPTVMREAEKAGTPRDWVLAAQRSPIWALISPNSWLSD